MDRVSKEHGSWESRNRNKYSPWTLEKLINFEGKPNEKKDFIKGTDIKQIRIWRAGSFALRSLLKHQDRFDILL